MSFISAQCRFLEKDATGNIINVIESGGEADRKNNVYKVLLYISKKRPDSWAYSTVKILRNT